MAKLRICVTGSTGFIGKHLLALLSLNDSIEVIPFQGDLLNKTSLNDFFEKNKKIDQIIHLVGSFFGAVDGLINLNTITTANLLEAAHSNGIKKIIYTSTGAVYGEPKKGKSSEEDNLSPNTLYGLSKKFAEDLIVFYKKFFEIEYVILRFPSVYGEDNNKGVVFSLLKSIKDDHKVIIYGDGQQSRDLLHVSDACCAIEKSISLNKSVLLNISNSKSYTINQIVELLREKYEFQVEYKPAENNLRDIALDISRAEHELSYSPKNKDLKI